MKRFALLFFNILIFTATALPQAIIENPEKPLSRNAGRTVETREAVRISDVSDKYYFQFPYNLKVASDGSIFVQDREQLLQFDPNGKFIRNFFKKGQGPGEMESIDNYWLNEKNVIIHGETPNKILWINFNGERVKEFRIYGKDVFLSFLTFCQNTYYFIQSEIPFVKGEPSIVDYPQNLISLSGEGGEIKNLISFPIKSFVAVVGGSRGSLAINRLIAVPYKEKYLFVSHTPEYVLKLYDLEKNQVIRIFKRKYKRVETPPEIQKQGGGYVMLNNQKFTKPPQKYMNDITNLFVFKDKLWVLTSTKDKNKGILIDVYDFEGKYVDNFYLKFPNYLSLDIYNLYTMTIAEDFLYLTQKKADETIELAKYKIEDK
jgi:hypothetical protein